MVPSEVLRPIPTLPGSARGEVQGATWGATGAGPASRAGARSPEPRPRRPPPSQRLPRAAAAPAAQRQSPSQGSQRRAPPAPPPAAAALPMLLARAGGQRLSHARGRLGGPGAETSRSRGASVGGLLRGAPYGSGAGRSAPPLAGHPQAARAPIAPHGGVTAAATPPPESLAAPPPPPPALPPQPGPDYRAEERGRIANETPTAAPSPPLRAAANEPGWGGARRPGARGGRRAGAGEPAAAAGSSALGEERARAEGSGPPSPARGDAHTPEAGIPAAGLVEANPAPEDVHISEPHSAACCSQETSVLLTSSPFTVLRLLLPICFNVSDITSEKSKGKRRKRT